MRFKQGKQLIIVLAVMMLSLVILIREKQSSAQNCVDQDIISQSSLVKHKQVYHNHDTVLMYQDGYKNLTNIKFLKYIRSHWIITPSRRARILRNPSKIDYSQHGQSSFVDRALGQKENGFFIECGAANGEHLSNSLFFELHRNWTGLLIEPNVYLFRALSRKRTHAYLLNALISVENSTKKFQFNLQGFYGSLYDHLATHEIKKVAVQGFPFISILYAIGNPRIDYFSLDVEGSELDILKTIPWNLVNIELLQIEYKVLMKRKKKLETNVEASVKKLQDLRRLIAATGLYREIGILGAPKATTHLDEEGLDVVFQKI